MITEFIKKWEENKGILEAKYKENHPADYDEIVKDIISILDNDDDMMDDETPDKERITVIDHSDYQGNRLYIIASKSYQPSDYWYVMVDYGTCSGCDTYENIRDDSDDNPTQKQVKDYMMLALHIVQEIKKLGDEDDN